MCVNYDHHLSKKCTFLVHTKWVCLSGTQRFCKNGSDSSRVILWKTWLESSHHFLNVTGVESESAKIVTRVESSHCLESRYYWSMVAGVWTSIWFLNLKNYRSRIRIQDFWIGVESESENVTLASPTLYLSYCWCQAKFLTSAKFLTYHCLSDIWGLKMKE